MSNSDSDPNHPAPSRYVIGIDLGTTNSALCYVDTQRPDWNVQTLAVPQLVAPAEIESRETLPSFLYLAAAGEFPSGALSLPWEQAETSRAVGIFAREQGKLVPGRVVESAKSWLCHPGVDRTTALLPWHGAEGVSKLSPVEASAAYLGHFRAAWNAVHPADRLEEQDVVITLPASFDEVARELTVQAAKLAGIPRLYLIEEPQAAFYAWIHSHADSWNALVSPGQNILVCDIGGGTSDFTLIRVRADAREKVQFHRVAVGDHLILGGDNLDLALAHHLEKKLSPQARLEPRQWGSLVRICRHAKETLLGNDAPPTYGVTLPGGGSKLIGAGLHVDVTREEVRQLLLEGFFPLVELNERPRRKSSGFQEFGLPYAADAAATRYLAQFLANHCQAGLQLGEEGSTRPDVVLFNGGVFMSSLVQSRVIDSLRHWYAQGDPDWTPLVLRNARHDLAVAQGAAYYGMVRRGAGVRIAAGLPRTYYLGVGTADAEGTSQVQALCLMPAGAEPGTEVLLQGHTFELTVATPVEFPLFHSSLRLTDPAGTLTPLEREQLTPLPPIRTILRARKEKSAATLPVQLHARLTEIGTLQIWCGEVGGSRTWQLQFDIRSATQTDLEAHHGTGESAGVLDEGSLHVVQKLIDDTFGSAAQEPAGGLPKRIARTLELSREEWPPSLLREIWEMLFDLESGRQRSADHEARWLNLLGFSLRPGYGFAMDDWRVGETWKKLRGKLYHPGPACLTEWWILWRRISGGLAAGQQQALANPLLTNLREDHRKSRTTGKSKRPGNLHEQAESWRMLGSLERLSAPTKQELGQIALEVLNRPEAESLSASLCWVLGRLGAREPLYGPLNEVLSPEVAGAWGDQLIASRDATPERLLAVMQLARKTNDRYRDLSETQRQRVLNWLRACHAPNSYLKMVAAGGELEAQTAAQVFGETLPIGLRISHNH